MQVLGWLGEHRSDLVLLVLVVVAGLNAYSFVAHRRATVEIKQLLLRLRSESFVRPSVAGSSVSALGICASAVGVGHRRFDFGERGSHWDRAVVSSARIMGADDCDA